MPLPRIICLTPVKNEEWILEKFLRCASLWADHIIVADQGSDDASRTIAARFPKVILVENAAASFHEGNRQQLLVEAARKLPSPRILIALDADEILTPNFHSSPDWQKLLNADPGTIINFIWANIRPDRKQYWSPPPKRAFGFVDDGSDFSGVAIHSTRIPHPPGAPSITMNEIPVMHYQYVDWKRMESKHRWYQALEHQMDPEKSAVNIYRMYHHMNAIGADELRTVPDWWFDDYERMGIDLRSVVKGRTYWWDRELLHLFEKRGTREFSQLAIWDVDWTAIARDNSFEGSVDTRDPRDLLEKLFHRYASMTQSYSGVKLVVFMDKVFRRLLRLRRSSAKTSA